MTRRKKNSKRRSRTRPPRKSEIRVVRDKSSRKRRRRRKRQVYRRRRIALLLGVFLIVGLPAFLLIRYLRSYSVMGYPDFRDEVLEDLASESFVRSTEGRSLTSAEKSSDFDILYEGIIRNFAVDEENKEAFENFVSKKDDYKKKISTSKTDQDFFMLVGEYLSLLNDSSTKILDKDTYVDLFDYYKNRPSSNIKKKLEEPQVVNRYKRIISDKKNDSYSMALESASSLRISLYDFRLKDLEPLIDELIDHVTKNPNIGNIIIDLAENKSANYLFVNEFIKYFIDSDYTNEDVFFYRGRLLEEDLEDIKKSEDSPYKTGYAKNPAPTYPGEADHFSKKDYSYYDEISIKIPKDSTFAKRSVYILTNQNTGCEAIRLASILKGSGAILVKNALDPSPSENDRVNLFRPSFLVLDHSGLIVTVNSSRAIQNDLYLDYDHRINSNDPALSIRSMIGG